ncbi:branched-chain alpha-keto acid dehydrogenase E1 subunit [Kyrpidia spormannii]|uniref:Branched-chain alpha-keto acid dehydrogenase E1 subunit n=3 Tax=Kyrpidia spormannii TaxID=2055160 RepID=A0ACA8Z9Z4_9BACL|nr:branched-chain alpha-keto acid dehydrogenase E1 subunit [Kyrpidia spormannii]CAB3393768.1 branched-chain alpha-keto acid dehydrogenase E1 subunit [Kyrpidia spormannii]
MSVEMRNRHEALGLTGEDLFAMYRVMLTARRVDERMWVLNRAGKIPFVISCQGHEGAQVGAAFALDRQKDYVLPYYRDVAVVLAFGQTPRDLLLAAHAKAEDPNSGGRQMPNHFGSRKHRIVSGSSPVSTQIPHAAGIALAARMRGDDVVTYVSFGEGSSNQGDFHEGLNFAAVHRLPVVFFCQNNGYAISVPTSKELATPSVADRAAGYGIPGVVVDGSDVLGVYHAVKTAVERARRGDGPTLVEAMTVRLTPHSSDDDDRTYRTKEELEDARRRDPLPQFAEYLIASGVADEDTLRALDHEVRAEVDEATAYAEQARDPDPADVLRFVYREA